MRSCGYHHREYVLSFSEFGEPIQLPRSGGWLLKRPIPGSKYSDAMGCYPLLTCDDWSFLFNDLRELKEKMVAIWLVTDPFATIEVSELRSFFSDVCYPFKEHLVVDLSLPRQATVSKHHQRYALKALKHLEICIPMKPESYVEIWTRLYGNLIKKHGIKGLTRFSEKAFTQQMKVPGCVVFLAVMKSRIIAMQIWYQYGDRAYYHLGASSEAGYRHYAAFGLFWEAIRHFQKLGLRWLNLGGGAGTKQNANDGLTRFKKGWASSSRPVYFCGVTMHPKQYNALCRTNKYGKHDFFPAYRECEFG